MIRYMGRTLVLSILGVWIVAYPYFDVRDGQYILQWPQNAQVHELSLRSTFILVFISSFILPLKNCVALLMILSLFLWFGDTLELMMQIMGIRSFPLIESKIYFRRIYECYLPLAGDKNSPGSIISIFILLCAVMGIPIAVKQLYLRYIKGYIKRIK